MEASDPDDLYARTSAALLAVHAAERAAAEFEAAMCGEADRWFFAISDMHQALTAALVETLTGTAGVGALTKASQKQWQDYFSDRPGSKPPARDRIAEFGVLLDRALDPANLRDMRGTLSLTEAEKRDILRLNEFRNGLAHVKPASWSIEIAGLPRILGAAAEAMRQLFDMAPLRLHLEEDQVERAEKTIAAIARKPPQSTA